MLYINKIPLKYLIIIGFLIVFFSPSHGKAEVNSVEEANEFLTNYCLVLVGEIEKSSQKQIDALERNRMLEFTKVGQWIFGISELYQNLNCTIYINGEDDK